MNSYFEVECEFRNRNLEMQSWKCKCNAELEWPSWPAILNIFTCCWYYPVVDFLFVWNDQTREYIYNWTFTSLPHSQQYHLRTCSPGEWHNSEWRTGGVVHPWTLGHCLWLLLWLLWCWGDMQAAGIHWQALFILLLFLNYQEWSLFHTLN